jgi:hypothetical protein
LRPTFEFEFRDSVAQAENAALVEHLSNAPCEDAFPVAMNAIVDVVLVRDADRRAGEIRKIVEAFALLVCVPQRSPDQRSDRTRSGGESVVQEIKPSGNVHESGSPGFRPPSYIQPGNPAVSARTIARSSACDG